MAQRILIVDDEPKIIASFTSLLKDEGYQPISANSAEEALSKVGNIGIDLMLLDLNLPGLSGVELLGRIHKDPDAPLTVVVSGQSEISTALEAIRLGAVDYLEKPVAPERLLSTVHAALMLSELRRQRNLVLEQMDHESPIVGRSAAIRKLLRIIDQTASSEATVLITGENGTGKELVATRLYLGSKRCGKPFVKVNCPGVPATLFESELFGHKKGAFTGAVRDYPGRFVLADGGTIFLDEIGDLPLECQAKLLRVLETGEVETLGTADRRTVDVRVVCASNRELPQLVREERFRQDLYYRISVMVIDVPPLRQRRDDIPILAGEFLRRFDPTGKITLSPEAMGFLATLDFPGNVRQLKNLMERITILHPEGLVTLDVLAGEAGMPPAASSSDQSLAEKVAVFEKHTIQETLHQCQGNIAEAARVLKMDRGNLSRKIKELGLTRT